MEVKYEIETCAPENLNEDRRVEQPSQNNNT